MSSKHAYHHGNLRPALIAAALKEIAQHGPEGFSLRGVARRAGVSAPAVYRHFADKDDLIAAVATECDERLDAGMQAAIAAAPDHPLERFRAQGIAVVRFAVAHPEHFRAITMPGIVGKLPRELRLRNEQRMEAQRATILAAQQAGLISALPIDDLLLTAGAVVQGLAYMIIAGALGRVDDARATELAIGVTAVLGVGLIPRPDAEPGSLAATGRPRRTRTR